MSDMRPYTTMHQMISQCEQALEQEDWSELNQTKTLNDFASVTVCNALGYLFESMHHVVKHRRSLSSLDEPLFLSWIRLHNPEIRLKLFNDEGKPLNVSSIGEVPIGYMDIILDTTQDEDGGHYTGPHFVGLINTGMIETEFVQEGIYTFLTPLRMVEVSQRHIPYELN